MYNGALLSGFMSGSCTYIPQRKYHLIWPKGEEKQGKDDYTCQGPFSGLSGGWSHDQFPKIVRKQKL